MDLLSQEQWKSLERDLMMDIILGDKPVSSTDQIHPTRATTPSVIPNTSQLPISTTISTVDTNLGYCPACGRSGLPILSKAETLLHKDFLAGISTTPDFRFISRQKVFNKKQVYVF